MNMLRINIRHDKAPIISSLYGIHDWTVIHKASLNGSTEQDRNPSRFRLPSTTRVFNNPRFQEPAFSQKKSAALDLRFVTLARPSKPCYVFADLANTGIEPADLRCRMRSRIRYHPYVCVLKDLILRCLCGRTFFRDSCISFIILRHF